MKISSSKPLERLVALAKRPSPLQVAVRRFLRIHSHIICSSWVLTSDGAPLVHLRKMLPPQKGVHASLLVVTKHFTADDLLLLPAANIPEPKQLILVGAESSELRELKHLLSWAHGRLRSTNLMDGPDLVGIVLKKE